MHDLSTLELYIYCGELELNSILSIDELQSSGSHHRLTSLMAAASRIRVVWRDCRDVNSNFPRDSAFDFAGGEKYFGSVWDQ